MLNARWTHGNECGCPVRSCKGNKLEDWEQILKEPQDLRMSRIRETHWENGVGGWGTADRNVWEKSEACAAIKPRISSLSIKVGRDAELNTSEKSNKLRIEKCPLNLVTEQALVTLLRTVSMQYHVQKPDCNSLKREWVETTNGENSFKKLETVTAVGIQTWPRVCLF